MIDIIHKCDIKPGYRSDHSFLEMHIMINPFKRGKGIWKFNNNLLYQKDYLNLINEIILEEKTKYAPPVYSLEFIKSMNSQLKMIYSWRRYCFVLGEKLSDTPLFKNKSKVKLKINY